MFALAYANALEHVIPIPLLHNANMKPHDIVTKWQQEVAIKSETCGINVFQNPPQLLNPVSFGILDSTRVKIHGKRNWHVTLCSA